MLSSSENASSLVCFFCVSLHCGIDGRIEDPIIWLLKKRKNSNKDLIPHTQTRHFVLLRVSKTFFLTKTILHDLLPNGHVHNCSLGIHSVWLTHNSLCNVLWGRNVVFFKQCLHSFLQSLHWMCPSPHAFFSAPYSIISCLRLCLRVRSLSSILTLFFNSMKLCDATNCRICSLISRGNQSE